MAKGKRNGPVAKNGSKVMPCTCKHEVQDSLYGKKRRLFNFGAKGAKCTVCEKIRA